MRIAQFPMLSQPRQPDADLALPLLEGIVADMRTQAQFLIKCLANHQEIDRDLWQDLADVAAGVFGGTDAFLCVKCLANQRVKIGQGRGFDPVLCDDCLHVELAR